MSQWTRMGAVSLLACGVLVGPSIATAAQAPEIRLAAGSQEVEWMVGGGAVALELTVGRPDGEVTRQTFAAGVAPRYHLGGPQGALAEGSYRWELRALPASPRSRGEAEAGGPDGEGAEALGWSTSGAFGVSGGSLFVGLGAESAAGEDGGEAVVPEATVLTNSDGVIRNSLCVGLDCPDSPSFSDSTIILTENNTRLKFDDTSSLGGFPNRDWQIFANDSASGGLNRFGVQDCGTGSGGGCSGNIPFTIEAGTPANALYVDSSGRVGFGTSNPVLELHVNDSDTPSLRLEQNGSGGFSPQTWDIAGNEANFFVRDVTSGSRLPFRIRPGAPSSSIDIAANGDVGIGTASPAAALHISRNTGAVATVARFSNNGGVQTLFDRTDAGANDWQMSNFNNTFQISIPGAATPQFSLNQNGNLTIGGTQYLTGSSRGIKENFEAVDGGEILARLIAMPLTSWNAKGVPEERHIGPIAEDWWAAFGLGPDDKHVGMTDLGGVALAAIKGLQAELAAREAAIAAQSEKLGDLERRNAELAARLARLEALLSGLPQE